MEKFILTPGPTECKDELLEVFTRKMIHHRSYAFKEIYKETREQLADMMHLDDGEIILLTSSGTGAMEASVANFFSKGDKVIVISIGYFGHRFEEITKVYGLDVIVLQYPLGETYDYDEVKTTIHCHPDVKGVFLTHHETGSGVCNKVEPIGELVNQLEDCLLIVDSISGFLIQPLEVSNWHIDCLLASSQKGFLIPPGIAIVGLSRKAINALNRGDLPRFYSDFRKYSSMLQINETPFTPNIPLIIALHESCNYINQLGVDNFQKHHYQLRVYLDQKLRDLGFDVDSIKEENKGNVMSLIRLKEGMNAKDIHRVLEEKGITVATGLGENATKVLRIGVIGDINKEHIDKFIQAFKETILEL